MRFSLDWSTEAFLANAEIASLRNLYISTRCIMRQAHCNYAVNPRVISECVASSSEALNFI